MTFLTILINKNISSLLSILKLHQNKLLRKNKLDFLFLDVYFTEIITLKFNLINEIEQKNYAHI